MSQSPDIEPQGPVQREPVTQESSEDAGSHSRSSLPDDPGLRHFAYIADKALNDPEWGVKTFAETLGPGSVERSGHFNPDGISLEDYEIRELERLLEAHNTTIERTHRVHHAGVRQALARAILRGHSNLIAEGASHALLDEAIEDMSSG